MNPRLALAAGLALAGCAPIEWRTDQPIAPSTYEAPAYRSATSIGRLSRLAVMPAVVHVEVDRDWSPQRKEQEVARGTMHQAQVVKYLVDVKGYEALHVAEPSGAWRGENEDAAAIREAGQRLKVDGVVVIERWVAQPWSGGKGILNLFMLNIPLFAAINAPSLRISIYETASGRLAWMRLLRGSSLEDATDRQLVPQALREIDNAVPAQLRR